MHYIQSYILDKLIGSEYLRNRDMRPPRVESNLYQYHLKQLIAKRYILKTAAGYTLAAKGLQYADVHSRVLLHERRQPKLATTLILRDSTGKVLVLPRLKQPFIGLYNLPSGKIHFNESLKSAARRELREKVGINENLPLQYLGSLHLTIRTAEDIVSESYNMLLGATLPSDICADGMFVAAQDILGNETAFMPGMGAILGSLQGKGNFKEIEMTIEEAQVQNP